jgi:hypothetical protein
VNLAALPVTLVLLADFCVPFFAGFLSAMVPLSYARFHVDAPHPREPPQRRRLQKCSIASPPPATTTRRVAAIS